MKGRKVIIACFLYLSTSVFAARPGDFPASIKQALESGDSKTLSRFFDASVELNFPQLQGVFAKSQAEQLLKKFFEDNGIGNFRYKELHESNRENMHNYIGQLYTGKGTYRIYMNMKMIDSFLFIYQMRIENND